MPSDGSEGTFGRTLVESETRGWPVTGPETPVDDWIAVTPVKTRSFVRKERGSCDLYKYRQDLFRRSPPFRPCLGCVSLRPTPSRGPLCRPCYFRFPPPYGVSLPVVVAVWTGGLGVSGVRRGGLESDRFLPDVRQR